MKKVLPLLILVNNLCHAQNWQCLQFGVKHYFTNDNGYLRGIRIDSARTSGSDVIYYPFHTPRGAYHYPTTILDSSGGSWLGKKVTCKPDGTFLFDNLSDTVIIQAWAAPGDSWVFYNDTSSVYYKAKVAAVDTMTISGGMDSIKRIVIRAFNSSGVIIGHPLDSFEIVLSKNNGFVQIFDLYTFPYNSIDYYIDNAANVALAPYTEFSPAYSGITKHTQLFYLISFINPTNEQLYDWNVGDVYEYRYCNGLCFWPTTLCDPPTRYTLDTITAKNITTTNTTYNYSGLISDILATSSYLSIGPAFYSISHSSNVFVYNKSCLVDTFLMPEEYKQQYIYYYLPNDTSYCIKSPAYVFLNNYIHDNEYWGPFEGPYTTIINKLHLGLVHFYSLSMDTSPLVSDQTLLYYSRGGTTCGSITTPQTGINDINGSKNVADLYPNPVTDVLTVSAGNNVTSLVISNVIGQIVYSTTCSTKKAEVETRNFPAGVYTVRINGAIVKKLVKQ